VLFNRAVAIYLEDGTYGGLYRSGKRTKTDKELSAYRGQGKSYIRNLTIVIHI